MLWIIIVAVVLIVVLGALALRSASSSNVTDTRSTADHGDRSNHEGDRPSA